jgi:hypothetical protein
MHRMDDVLWSPLGGRPVQEFGNWETMALQNPTSADLYIIFQLVRRPCTNTTSLNFTFDFIAACIVDKLFASFGHETHKYLHVKRITSRKHGKKEPHSFFHYGSFDHPELQSLNECKKILLVYQLNF